jgi:hypothetical protein
MQVVAFLGALIALCIVYIVYSKASKNERTYIMKICVFAGPIFAFLAMIALTIQN